jgi:Histidine kinase-like ATPase domain
MDKRKRRVISHLQAREARFDIQNDPELIDPLIELLLEDLCVMGDCDSTGRMQVGVALQEAISNGVYHGNLEISSGLRQEDELQYYALANKRRGLAPYRDRRIQIHARVNRGEACFVIQDEGPGFDTPNMDRHVEPEELLRIRGRGLLLIRSFMDDVKHNAEGNRITMIKRSRADKVIPGRTDSNTRLNLA